MKIKNILIILSLITFTACSENFFEEEAKRKSKPESKHCKGSDDGNCDGYSTDANASNVSYWTLGD